MSVGTVDIDTVIAADPRTEQIAQKPQIKNATTCDVRPTGDHHHADACMRLNGRPRSWR